MLKVEIEPNSEMLSSIMKYRNLMFLSVSKIKK